MSATYDRNLGPLTTTFSRPNKCGGPIFSDACETCTPARYTAWQNFKCTSNGANIYAIPDTSCFPGFTSFHGAYFSPGLICPSGYTTACSSTVGHKGAQDYFFEVPPEAADGEHVFGCCPSAYSCGRILLHGQSSMLRSSQACVRTMWSSDAISTPVPLMQCDLNGGSRFVDGTYWNFASTKTIALSGGTWTSTSPTVISFDAIEIYAPLIQLHQGSNDVANPSALASETANPGGSREEGAEPRRSGLSGAAATGIGVAIGVIVLSIIAATVWLFLRTRRRRQVKKTDPTWLRSNPGVPDANENWKHLRVPELSSTSATPELTSTRQTQELPSTFRTPELAGESRISELPSL